METNKMPPNGKIPSRVTGFDEVAERPTDVGNIAKAKTNAAKQKQTKKSRLLANQDVRRWYDNLARGSVNTAEGRLRRLGRFCELHGTTPAGLADLAMRDLRTATDLVEDHITMMESEAKSPGYIEEQVKTVKSWLRHFDVEVKRKIRVRKGIYAPTLQNERVPEGHEMAEIYSWAGLRESAIISLMAKSGLRPEVIGNHDGTDGLRMTDLPDVVIHQGVAKCVRAPNRVMVRPQLSKASHRYFTYCTQAGTQHILAYLNDRITRGEPLDADSPVIAPDHVYRTNRGANSSKRFLPTPRVSRLVRETFRPRFNWRPYVLRAYFDTQLLIAESKGKMAHDFRVFFMGHKGSMEARYTTNKGVLPESLVSEMRNAFAHSEEHLDQAAVDPLLEQRQDIQNVIQEATPEQLGRVLEVLQIPARPTRPTGGSLQW